MGSTTLKGCTQATFVNEVAFYHVALPHQAHVQTPVALADGDTLRLAVFPHALRFFWAGLHEPLRADGERAQPLRPAAGGRAGAGERGKCAGLCAAAASAASVRTPRGKGRWRGGRARRQAASAGFG